jgi:predicted transcriptional regulator
MSAMFKQEAHRLVDALPEGATWTDLIEQARFRKAVEEGIFAAERGEFASDEEVRRAFHKWAVDVAG